MRRTTSATPRARSARGASAVELAFVLPFLLVLVFGIISFGLLFAQQLALGNSARQAARFGVVDERTCADISTQAKAAATTIGMSGTNATVSVMVGASEDTAANPCGSPTNKPCSGSAAGDSVYVRVDYTSRLFIPLVIIDNTFDIHGKGVFRCEFS